MSFRLNLQGNLPQQKTAKPTLEELTKDMPNLKNLEASEQSRMKSIVEGLKSIAVEKFKFNSGNSIFTGSASLKNDVI